MRPKHPDKDIERAVQHAEAAGWKFTKGHGHAWGILRCPRHDAACRCGTFCQMSIWSTPKNPSGFAKQLCRHVDGCIHAKKGEKK